MNFPDRIGGLTGWRQLLLAVATGAVMGLAQAPWSLPLVFILALSVIYWLHAGALSARRAALLGWLVGVGYFGLTLAWIVEPFLVDIARHGWMAPFALFFMAAGLASFWALAFGLAARQRVMVLVVLWTLVEMARSYVFTGFPWGLIGYGWVETPIIQTASLVGVHGLGFFTLTAMALLSRAKLMPLVSAAGILAVMWGFGTYRLSQPMQLRADAFTVRIVQPNVEQKLKWLPEFQNMFFQRLKSLSSGEKPVGVVIWPEAAIPFFPRERPDLLQEISIAAQGSEVILGARRRDASGNWFNQLVLLDGDGVLTENYDKHHLVPFGEYVPLSGLLSTVGLSALTGNGFTAGDGPKVMRLGDTPPFLPLICYEAIFPQHAKVSGERPDWIVQITNDAWFGQFSGPYQHLAQSRVRAIEQGLPLARSANTGVSAMLDPYGRIVGSVRLNQIGSVDVGLPAPLPATVYSRFGDWPVLAMLLAMLLALIFLQLFARKRRQS